MGKRFGLAKQAKRRAQLAILAAALGFASWSVWGGGDVGNVGGVWSVEAVATAQETASNGERALAVVAKEPEKCAVLLVGVDKYKTLPSLQYASSDVRALRDALVDIGFPFKSIRTLVSDGDYNDRPSREAILAALDEILEASGPDSTVLIALSGHGFETENGAAAFCPEDVEVKQVGGKPRVTSETAILIEDVAKSLRKDDAKFKLLIVDACREPASTERGADAKARSFNPIPEPNGVAFLQSCESQELSWEHPELNGGVFSAFFAKGLRGAADSDGDGGVSFLDVCNYATSQTQRFVKDKRDAVQTPFYRFSGVVDFWLKPPTGKPRPPVAPPGGGSGWLPLALLTLTGGVVVFAVWTERNRRRTAEALAAATSGANVSGVATGPASATQSSVATEFAPVSTPVVVSPEPETSSWEPDAEDPSRKAWEEAERRAESERRAREAAERKIREAERKAQEAEARAASERKAREAAERADAERRAREETERQVREAERKAQEAAARAESERKAREAAENERKAREEAERQARDAERRAQEAEARAASERKAREAEERAAAERRAREEAERKAREAERKAKEAEARAEAERKAREAAKRKASVAASNGWSAEHRAGTRKTLQIKGVEYAFRYCPAGTFLMGSPESEEGRFDDETQHQVTLTNGFWMLETPVTQAMWKSVMGSNPSEFCSSERNPVESVSWNDCQDFIKKLNSQGLALDGFKFRLPSEAEWEYACRAGTTTSYFWGDSLNGDKANCDGNYPCGTRTEGQYLERTTKVGSYAANPWGLYDMHGNVWEWCEDLYTDYENIKTFQNPINVTRGSNRVVRGGSWINGAANCRSANRGNSGPSYRNGDCGFRLALVRSSSSR